MKDSLDKGILIMERFREQATKIREQAVQMMGDAHLRACGWLRYGLRMRPNRRVGIAHQIEKMSKQITFAIPMPKLYSIALLSTPGFVDNLKTDDIC